MIMMFLPDIQLELPSAAADASHAGFSKPFAPPTKRSCWLFKTFAPPTKRSCWLLGPFAPLTKRSCWLLGTLSPSTKRSRDGFSDLSLHTSSGSGLRLDRVGLPNYCIQGIAHQVSEVGGQSEFCTTGNVRKFALGICHTACCLPLDEVEVEALRMLFLARAMPTSATPWFLHLLDVSTPPAFPHFLGFYASSTFPHLQHFHTSSISTPLRRFHTSSISTPPAFPHLLDVSTPPRCFHTSSMFLHLLTVSTPPQFLYLYGS
ncbi:hypothetical protein BJ508DRAFT_309287 [Ascobolus immersus RN42]|uniref:Uncharacterized protein n=1 Tax=Ascobolus immersus RN42 TaxID=1160509 RepID=A0A3N4HWU4_ASCIM|nr:hypothetical protein BJ508DRAFT_309287 [Ascobolus immersus RN42]